MSEALKGLRECLPRIEERLHEATELHAIAREIGDTTEAKKWEKAILGARKDIEQITSLTASSGS